MAVKRKAPAKSKVAKAAGAGESKAKTIAKTKTAAKRVATKAATSRAKATPTRTKSTSSRTTVTKSTAKASSPARTRTAASSKVAASTKKSASVKKPAASAKKTVKATAKSPAVAKKKAAPKKAAPKKVAAKKAAPKKAASKAAAPKAKAKVTTVGKTTVKVRRKTAKQTAAARKAVLSAAAMRFQATGGVKKAPNVSGSTRAASLKAGGAKQKHAAVRALTVMASTRAGSKKVANLASDSANSGVDKADGSGGSKKPVSQRHGFKIGEPVVYPAHGVGKIVGIEEQEIAGIALELFVIHFEKEKLTLRVPTGKVDSVGMRKLSEEALVSRAMTVLKGRARVKRTMWSRRAQEYVAKINSGDLIQIAEVVRDLYRSESQPEQSYSERQLYEDALDRMAREVAAVEKLDERGAVQSIIEVLSKSARNRRAQEESADSGSSTSKAA